jgi:hypothetical protein
MRLIVDSGSTKAGWVLCKEDEMVSSFNTIGFNEFIMGWTWLLRECDPLFGVPSDSNSDILKATLRLYPKKVA